jgi:hypothetical protein
MSKLTLDEIVEEVKTLTSDEQRKLRELLDELLKEPPTRSPEEELEHKLFEAGLLSEIKPSTVDVESYRRYQPIEVKGKPVSETLIEERR